MNKKKILLNKLWNKLSSHCYSMFCILSLPNCTLYIVKKKKNQKKKKKKKKKKIKKKKKKKKNQN